MKLQLLVVSFALRHLGAVAFVCRPSHSSRNVPADGTTPGPAGVSLRLRSTGSVAFLQRRHAGQALTALSAEKKVAALVSGEELEKLLVELDQPLVVDAYATWCGPCLLMSPEFESAASELEGKVRFVKLDTDKDESMAARLQIQGLPTLLFLDKYDGDESGAKAVLKGRIEGALRKSDIISLCEHYYFGAPAPELY